MRVDTDEIKIRKFPTRQMLKNAIFDLIKDVEELHAINAIQVSCSCGFEGKIKDLLIDDEEHRRFFCPVCRLIGGLKFIQE